MAPVVADIVSVLDAAYGGHPGPLKVLADLCLELLDALAVSPSVCVDILTHNALPLLCTAVVSFCSFFSGLPLYDLLCLQ